MDTTKFRPYFPCRFVLLIPIPRFDPVMHHLPVGAKVFGAESPWISSTRFIPFRIFPDDLGRFTDTLRPDISLEPGYVHPSSVVGTDVGRWTVERNQCRNVSPPHVPDHKAGNT